MMKIFILCFSTLLLSCTKVFVSKSSYIRDESLIIKDFFIHSESKLGDNFRIYNTELDNVDTDSLFKTLLLSFDRFGINYELKKGGQNQLFNEEYSLKIGPPLNYKVIDTSFIVKMGNVCSECAVLVPYLYIHNHYDNPGGNLFKSINESNHLDSVLSLYVFIVKNKKIIYSSYSFVQPYVGTARLDRPILSNKIHTEEDWDLIVRRAFRKYLKRLK